MRKLEYRLMMMGREARQGSYATRAAREYTLRRAARDLWDAGYRFESPKGLKPRHVDHLVRALERTRGDGDAAEPHGALAVVGRTPWGSGGWCCRTGGSG